MLDSDDVQQRINWKDHSYMIVKLGFKAAELLSNEIA